MHNGTDHQIQHPAAAVVELVEPAAAVAAVVAAAAGKDRKPWSKDKELGVVVNLDWSALPQVVSTSCLNLVKITNGPHSKLKWCCVVLC